MAISNCFAGRKGKEPSYCLFMVWHVTVTTSMKRCFFLKTIMLLFRMTGGDTAEAGGIIAVELAGKYPELVRGIILQEPPLTWSIQSKNDISKWRTELKDALEKKHINSALISLNRAMGGTDNRSKSRSLESQRQNPLPLI